MRLTYCCACGGRLGLVAPCRCPSCGYQYWRNPKPGASAVVVRDGRVLLMRRASEPQRGRWEVPGGFCEPTEHPALTAAREVLEETGLAVRVGETLGMWMDT